MEPVVSTELEKDLIVSFTRGGKKVCVEKSPFHFIWICFVQHIRNVV